ncbi:MAG TPA: VOC family protein [Actinomycetota bacterium]|nr:VOC family protein [Actinomycetota bacterium]
MLETFTAFATLPAADLDRAKAWYREKLGLEPFAEDAGGVWFESGGHPFLVYPSQFAGTARSTAIGWHVDDIRATVDALRDRGVTFEEYDLPEVKTERGIARIGTYLAAWFRDSEGNLLMIDHPGGAA